MIILKKSFWFLQILHLTPADSSLSQRDEPTAAKGEVESIFEEIKIIFSSEKTLSTFLGLK